MGQNKPGVQELMTLRWMETSGVDHSANEEEGWAVMKAANLSEDQLAELIKKEEAIVERQESLAKSLESAEAFLVDASDEVKDAVKTLVSHLEKEGVREPVEGKEGKDSETLARKAINIAKRLLSGDSEEGNVDDMIKRLEENWSDFCKEVAGIVNGDDSVEAKQEAAAKAVEGLQAKVLQA